MSATRNTEDLSKLPKWAQRRIATLEMRLAEERKRIAQFDGPIEDTNTVADPYDEVPRPLRRDATIEFRLDDWTDDRGWQQNIRARVRRDVDGSFVEIHGGRGLTVRPWSSNVLRVTVD